MPDAETIPSCDVCHSGPGQCECTKCPNCGEYYPPQHLCENCERCEDCCECAVCGRSRCAARVDNVCDHCERCDNCCECINCDSCGERVDPDSVCRNCRSCAEGCCECRFCDTCGDPLDFDNDDCSDCGCCEQHCTCRRDCAVEFDDRPLRFHKSARGQFTRNPSKRLLACELEIASADDGAEIDRVCDRWSCPVVEDGSLPSSGFEICTSPANGDQFIKQITQLGAALKSGGAEVTSACGYHVHADARDFTYWDIRRLILLYAKLEDALFSCIPASRRRSHYCQPCGEQYVRGIREGKDWRKGTKAKDDIIKNVYGHRPNDKIDGQQFRGRRRCKYDGARYHALNLHSWFFRGTVECRMAAGTTDPVKIIHWALLWGAILDYAYSRTEKGIESLPAVPWEVLMAVAPSDACREWLAGRRAKHG